MSTFSELKTMFTDRGWSRATTTQQGNYINWAVHELDSEELWPYRETSVTGTAPLAITDLGVVETVFDTTTNAPLEPTTYTGMLNAFGDLSLTGSQPLYWYFTTAGSPSVSTYPVTTRTIKVVYWKVGTDLSANGDTPLVPARWQHIIVMKADRIASETKGDYARAAAIRDAEAVELEKMRAELLRRQVQAPNQFVSVMPTTY